MGRNRAVPKDQSSIPRQISNVDAGIGPIHPGDGESAVRIDRDGLDVDIAVAIALDGEAEQLVPVRREQCQHVARLGGK
jgi:hypothetical protein